MRRWSRCLTVLRVLGCTRRAPAPDAGPAAVPRPRADGRLPPLAHPTRYTLELVVDPAQPRFSGRARIAVIVDEPTVHVCYGHNPFRYAWNAREATLARRAFTRPALGLVFSQPVLLTLVSSGLTRDEAYRVVQDAARTAWAKRRSFRAVIEGDDRVKLSAEELDDAFSLDHSLRNTSTIFDSLEGIAT